MTEEELNSYYDRFTIFPAMNPGLRAQSIGVQLIRQKGEKYCHLTHGYASSIYVKHLITSP